MADNRTMGKRRALSIAGFALLALVVLVPIANSIDTLGGAGLVLQLMAFVVLLTFLVAAVRAGWMYWRDWYRR